ncbi:hypothetical protein MGG_08928 [Pyricularia oryzae 70-15]|uniref:Mediator of RNA polymerase II transcription subunit 18 n=1 Tax=Pyricularia oryzae (strain 70-15 / ATCC MYA-4617 / FGSC 8958) TaxID=242507 RepID=G4MVZ9_PYRO7|nr:uncharacterized protein MGG_08928 [Pyricularia oryzae 70-15]EHA54152.1 hypothetical protein MGG_08928 [Pyricularia oryzae 70-15]KAI7930892.1 hypothetical protein M9X92_000572 [Pyricularia oryzae]KAI7932424.1 hypothetical protein M0657_000554 [Pyricularia oryzae]
MQDLFLTTFVRGGDEFERACAVLQAVANMSGWHSLHRVVFYSGPLPPKGFANSRSAQPANQPPGAKPSPQQLQQTAALWGLLNQALTKTSYIMQARYEVFKDRDFVGLPNEADASAAVDGEVELNRATGTLRWTDLPIKQPDNNPVTQRKRIDISDHKNLIAVFKDNNHTYKSEAIEESVSYYIDSVEITLVRYYKLPDSTQPLTSLPTWPSLQLVDPSGTWMLFLRTTVQEENAYDKIKEAQEELYRVRDQLGGVFEFKVYDRRVHDTRIIQQANNMPAPLPQIQRARG